MAASRTTQDPAGIEDSDPRPADGLAVAEAARRIGVAATTLRAWDRRYGVGPSGRTAGGHRRYSSTDIADLQRLRRLTDAGMPTAAAAVRARVRPRGSVTGRRTKLDPAADRQMQRFIDASDTLDPARLSRAADAVLKERGALSAWTDIFLPQLQLLGQRWEGSGGGIAREHVTAGALQTALDNHIARHIARHTARHAGRQRGVQVVAAATPTEDHTLPLHALAAALAESGVGTCILGTVPAYALYAAVDDIAPVVSVLWARSTQTAEPALLRQLLTRTPVACAAGPGWRRSRLPRGIPHLRDLPGAVDSVLAWTT